MKNEITSSNITLQQMFEEGLQNEENWNHIKISDLKEKCIALEMVKVVKW